MNDPFAPGLLARLPECPRRVVIVRATRIGDWICATPAFRALRAALPEAELTLIGLPFVRELVARSPHLDRFVEFPGFPGLAEQFFDARRTADFFQAMQAEHFDLALQMNGSGVYANPFTLMLGATVTAGFIRAGDSPSRLDAACPIPETGNEVRRWLALTTFLGAPAQGEKTEFALAAQDRQAAAELLANAERPLIGIHPAAREATKRWAPERFAAVANTLQARLGGTVIVLGGKAEAPLARAVAAETPAPCLNLAGRTTLPELGAVIEQLAILITNDSGPAHIAYALDTPSVTIFGGTDPARWGPLDSGRHCVVVNAVPCHPCDYWECTVSYMCLEGIGVEQVILSAEEVLRRAARVN